MSDELADERRLILEAGNVVILHPSAPAGGFPLVVAVDRVSEGLHWFLGSCDPLRRGETLMVEASVHDDARYVTRGRIEARSSGTFALRLEPRWQRVQQRAFVRISAHGLQVRVVRTKPEVEPAAGSDAADEATLCETPPGDVYELLDISAGGIRFRSADDFETDEEVVCHFELPGSLCFVLPARVVRSSSGAPQGAPRRGIGVEFVAIEEQQRAELLRWVYREQVRRHRVEERAARDRETSEHQGTSRRRS